MTIDGKCYEGYPIAKGYRDDDEKKTQASAKPVVQNLQKIEGMELAFRLLESARIMGIEISAIRREYIIEACERPE